MNIRHVATGAVTLEIAESGRGGRPLLLMHGFTGAKEDFTDLVDDLAALGWHAVVPDLRGHGNSDKPPGESSYSLRIRSASTSNCRPAGCGRRSSARTLNDSFSSARTARASVIELATCTIPTIGFFPNDERAVHRLLIAIPISLLLLLVLIYAPFAAEIENPWQLLPKAGLSHGPHSPFCAGFMRSQSGT